MMTSGERVFRPARGGREKRGPPPPCRAPTPRGCGSRKCGQSRRRAPRPASFALLLRQWPHPRASRIPWGSGSRPCRAAPREKRPRCVRDQDDVGQARGGPPGAGGPGRRARGPGHLADQLGNRRRPRCAPCPPLARPAASLRLQRVVAISSARLRLHGQLISPLSAHPRTPDCSSIVFPRSPIQVAPGSPGSGTRCRAGAARRCARSRAPEAREGGGDLNERATTPAEQVGAAWKATACSRFTSRISSSAFRSEKPASRLEHGGSPPAPLRVRISSRRTALTAD